MTVLHMSVLLNVYLLIGIVLFSLSPTSVTQSRLLAQKQRYYVCYYTLGVILLWPFNFFIHYFVQEKVISKY